MNSKNQKLVLGVVCAALFPNIVQVVKPDVKYKASVAGEWSRTLIIPSTLSYASHSQASKGTKRTEQIALAESCSCFSGDQDTFKAPPTIKCHIIAKDAHKHASDKRD